MNDVLNDDEAQPRVGDPIKFYMPNDGVWWDAWIAAHDPQAQRFQVHDV